MWCKLSSAVLVIICTIITFSSAQEIQIPQGILRGDTRTNRDGGTFYAFKNIPFAEPPVGELRFKAPEKAGGWEGVRDATEELPYCVQSLLNPGTGQEDCLYLNVYTPELPGENNVLKPVMVYIYGGYFMAGDAREVSLGPQYLMTEDVVIVIANYRVGIFGFLTLDDPDLGITGNAGLKDQVVSLQWVQENIEYFGGDPNNVLIFGISAGGASVHMHMLSPLSEGLFHKAISQSGVAISPLIITNLRNNAVIMAEELGIQSENWTEMLTTLQKISTENILNAELSLNNNGYPHISLPIVEITSNGSTFLAREPMDIIRSGDFKQVPYMNGFVSLEGVVIFIDRIDDGVSPLIPDLSKYIPTDLRIEPGSEAEQHIVQRFKDFYYDGRESSRENITADINFFGDYSFNFPHYRTTREQLELASNPIYLYYFAVDIDDGINIPGASHGADTYHIFQIGTPFEEGSPGDFISRNLVDMWTNFAIYDNPTPEGFDYTWKAITKDEMNYLLIGDEGSFPAINLLPENMQLWSEIYEEYYPN